MAYQFFCLIKKMTDRIHVEEVEFTVFIYLFIQEITLKGNPFGFVKATKFAKTIKIKITTKKITSIHV